jgi:hypothetical protein
MSYPVLIIPEGIESSDGRSYNAGVLSWRETIPLMFTDETTDGHGGAFQVGVITNVRRQTFEGQTWIIGDLSYDIDAEAAEAERLAVENQIPGVSADVAAIFEETGELDEMGLPVFAMVSAEIVGATQIPMPAFGDARILTETQIPVLVAALPPEVKRDWFKNPQLDGPTRLTVDGGRVYGHLATWGECHTGYANVCKTPPKGTDYRYFHTGTLEVEGEKIEVGKITMDTGHAPLTFSATEARQAHYDNTGTCAADVCAGEDDFGIWVAGAVREGVDAQILMASPLSGDWRKIAGNMELLAALAVNTPGFAPPRLQASTFNGEQVALVAAGIVQEEEPDPLAELIERVSALEAKFEVPDTPEPIEEQEWGKLASVL